jgi:hypothetical protein
MLKENEVKYSRSVAEIVPNFNISKAEEIFIKWKKGGYTNLYHFAGKDGWNVSVDGNVLTIFAFNTKWYVEGVQYVKDEQNNIGWKPYYSDKFRLQW